MQVPPQDKIIGWQEMVEYMDRTWATKKGVKHYPWNGRDFKELLHFCHNFGVGGVMALWDIYLEGQTYWGGKSGHMIDGLVKDIGVLLDDRRYKQLSIMHQRSIDVKSGLHDAKDIIDNVPIGKLKIIGGNHA